MRLISGNSLNTLLLILMSIAYSYSLLRISYVIMSPYRGGIYRLCINLSLKMYVAMDSNLDNGVEIQNAACGWSWIMMRVRFFKSASNEADQ